jgi:hypothetical protein
MRYVKEIMRGALALAAAYIYHSCGLYVFISHDMYRDRNRKCLINDALPKGLGK